LDLALTNASMDDSFFRQLPDHTFASANALWGIASDSRAHWGIVAADFHNDDDIDEFVANGGWKSIVSNQILRNDLNEGGIFFDASPGALDFNLIARSFSAAALDHDNDG